MYVINKAFTGIPEIDNGLGAYFGYLAYVNVLPKGTYVLAGGSIRALFDKTAVRDLDIYILGDTDHHNMVLNQVSDRSPGTLSVVKFCNPFAFFRLINITPDNIEEAKQNKKQVPLIPEDDPAFFAASEEIDPWPGYLGNDKPFSAPIQLLSYHYDSHYYERNHVDVRREERFADTPVSTLAEVVGSFDMTIAKGAVEFIVTDSSVIVSSVNIPHDCLLDICMRKLRLSSSNKSVPQQLCTIKRFHKYIKMGYDVDESFYILWRERFTSNPHVLELSYD